ncbi:GtrA family protein [Paenibacillus sp.]|uniref:GtrA family protein n=1 Tax=Paenibacillus sp. TaxID=58172 RepID=UPI002D3C3DF6|nr:GtrA family protein [Paenibacillus sp.]HZG88400.1 GtrA family protein [Paenibacillus sp.]
MGSFGRFLLVGVANTAVGYAVMFSSLALGVPYAPATFAGTLAGLCVSFALNRRFTFRHTGGTAGAAARFAAVSLLCYLAAYPGARAALAGAAAAPLTADQTAAIAGSVLYTGLHYVLLRTVVFSRAKCSRGRT